MRDCEKELLLEEQKQIAVLYNNESILSKCPDGRLIIRKRYNRTDYYHEIGKGSAKRQINITKNLDLIKALTAKVIAEKRIIRASANVSALKKAKNRLKSTDIKDILAELPDKYAEAVNMLRKKCIKDWLDSDYERARYNPKSHIHETCYGDLVRSKSEVIIANALYSFDIPFHYEEKFKYPSENGDWYYPDFTIILPDGSKLIWEHFGLLKELGYCVKNAYKLHTYQQNNYVIGKNIIITQDDNKGNCSSAQIYDIIKEQILPLFTALNK